VSQETLDAVVALAGAINAGVCQAVANRGYKEPGYPQDGSG
jgi:hypothetical protein